MLSETARSEPATDTESATHTEEVMRAANRLIAAFGAHDTASYFSCFSADATFVFYTHPNPLEGRAEYERLWSEWEARDEFRIVACASSKQNVKVRGEIAIFTHAVSTTVSTVRGTETLAEWETIVFEKQGGRWLAVHEHLSPASEI